MVKNITDFVNGIAVQHQNGTWEEYTNLNSLVVSSGPFYAAYCFTIKLEMSSEFFITFKPSNEISKVHIVFKDTEKLLGRGVSEQDLAYIGGRDIEILRNATVMKMFDIEISQNVYVEEDKTKNCRNYPTSEYETYDACDKAFCLDKMEEIFKTKFVPIWAATNMSQVINFCVMLLSYIHILR